MSLMSLEKNNGFSILVFQNNTSKNQDFFMIFSAPMSNFRTSQDQWEPWPPFRAIS